MILLPCLLLCQFILATGTVVRPPPSPEGSLYYTTQNVFAREPCVGHGFCGLLSGDLPGCVVPQSRFAAGAPGPPCGCPKPALCTIRSGGQPCTCRRQDVYLPPFYHLLGFHRAKDADAATYRVESLGPVQQLKKGTPTGGPPLTIKEFLKGPSEGPHRKKEKKKKKKKKKKGESAGVTDK